MKKLISFIISLSFLSIGLQPAHAVENRIIDIVSITWPGAPSTSVSVTDVKNSIENEVATRWNYLAQNWPGGINFKVGNVVSTPIAMSVPLICEGTDSSAYMRDARRAFYTKYPIEDYASRYLILLSPAPRFNCVWEGKSLIGEAKTPGGLVILKNSASAFVITHELGHTLGLGHTNLVNCPNGAKDGSWKDCSAVEYGGAVDVMSNVDIKDGLSTYHLWRMGIIPDTDIKQVWQTQTIDLSYTNSASNTRAIFIRDGKQTYWVEYRKQAGLYNAGLAIYRTDPPPATSVVSPNIKDVTDIPTEAVTLDVWLLNLDSYVYINSYATFGSPTLQLGKTFLDGSGNVSVSAVQKDENTVSVTVTRKPDLIAPPTPELTDSKNWVSPDSELIKSGYEDGETAIDKFQISIDGVVSDISGSAAFGWYPTYLSPFNPRKSIHLKELPEGTYSFKVRGVDLAGNVSPWSNSASIVIDRGNPVVTSDFKLNTDIKGQTKLTWTGAKDLGSGICSVQVANSDGFIVARTDRTTNLNSAPELTFFGDIAGKAQVFDCRGNGVEGQLSLGTLALSASKARTTGKVTTTSQGVSCIGLCNFSFTVNGDVEVKTFKGSGQVYLNSALVGNFSPTSDPIRISIGKNKKIIRVSGKNIGVTGISQQTVEWKATGTVQRKVSITDPSLEDPDQLAVSKYGFQIDDFDSTYQVLPIARGTTLLDATLDICSGDYPSEKSRTLRRQVAAFNSKNEYLFISTETVRYKDANSAQSALTDIDNVVALCKKTGGATNTDGSLTSYQFETPPAFDYSTGITGRVVLTKIGDGADTRWLLGYFQIKGDLAVNTYLVRTAKFTDEDLKRWGIVAKIISTRLSTYSPVN